jgi:hypothetical protein
MAALRPLPYKYLLTVCSFCALACLLATCRIDRQSYRLDLFVSCTDELTAAGCNITLECVHITHVNLFRRLHGRTALSVINHPVLLWWLLCWLCLWSPTRRLPRCLVLPPEGSPYMLSSDRFPAVPGGELLSVCAEALHSLVASSCTGWGCYCVSWNRRTPGQRNCACWAGPGRQLEGQVVATLMSMNSMVYCTFWKLWLRVARCSQRFPP